MAKQKAGKAAEIEQPPKNDPVAEKAAEHAPMYLPGVPLIHQKMVAVLRDIGAVGKDRENTQQKYKYRGAEDLLNAMHPVLAKHGVFIQSSFRELKEKEGKAKSGATYTEISFVYECRFTAIDGSQLLVEFPAQASDYGDKAVYKAVTMALKYALATTFCVPFAELDEGDEGAKIEKGSASQALEPAPLSEEEVKLTIEKAVAAGSTKILLGMYNRMPQAQQAQVKDRLAEARREIEEAKGGEDAKT